MIEESIINFSDIIFGEIENLLKKKYNMKIKNFYHLFRILEEELEIVSSYVIFLPIYEFSINSNLLLTISDQIKKVKT